MPDNPEPSSHLPQNPSPGSPGQIALSTPAPLEECLRRLAALPAGFAVQAAPHANARVALTITFTPDGRSGATAQAVGALTDAGDTTHIALQTDIVGRPVLDALEFAFTALVMAALVLGVVAIGQGALTAGAMGYAVAAIAVLILGLRALGMNKRRRERDARTLATTLEAALHPPEEAR
jgi:hypothetical protein